MFSCLHMADAGCKSLTPTRGATQQSVGKRNKKERTRCVRPKKNLALHSGRSFAANAESSLCNKRHLYSGPSCGSPLEAPRNKRHLYSASSCDIWRSKALIKNGYLKIKLGYLTPAFLGAHKWAEMLPNPCILGGPQQRGQNFRAPKRGRNCYVTPAFSGIPKRGG